MTFNELARVLRTASEYRNLVQVHVSRSLSSISSHSTNVSKIFQQIIERKLEQGTYHISKAW